MSWLSGTESALSSVDSTLSGLAQDVHTVIGSGGAIYANGEPLITSGVTAGDITETVANTNSSSAINFTGIINSITSDPFLMLVIIGGFILLIIKK